jgi:hypothetical protein
MKVSALQFYLSSNSDSMKLRKLYHTYFLLFTTVTLRSDKACKYQTDRFMH